MIDGAFASASSTVCPSTPGAPLLRTTFNSARARLASDATSSSSRLVSTTPAPGPLVSCSSLCAAGSRAARMRPKAWPPRPPKGCRRTRGSIVVVPSFSIHLSLCSTGFHRLHCSYEEIRLLHGHRPVVVASFGSTARADPRSSPWVRTLDVPQPPLPLPPRPRLDFGHRVRRHAHPADPACSGVHFRSVPRFASGFFPTRPHGASRLPSHDAAPLRAVASGSRLLPTRPAKDFHLQSSAHARHTFETALRASSGRGR